MRRPEALIPSGEGIWRTPIQQSSLYDAQYWAEYRKRDMGFRLTRARGFLALHYGCRTVVDVGIGGGAFVEYLGCQGTDINPLAIEWLRKRNALWDESPVEGMTFWDSLEHIEDPSFLLAKCQKYAFISTPIYEDAEAVYRSKHFKPGEHVLYFTIPGLKSFMRQHSFEYVDSNSMESDLGREGIGTFIFKRES